MTETKITPASRPSTLRSSFPLCRKSSSTRTSCRPPKIVKVVVNMGVGEAARDAKLMDGAIRDLTAITGQKPIVYPR